MAAGGLALAVVVGTVGADDKGAKVADVFNFKMKKLDGKDARYDHHRVEALWVYANLREPNIPLLTSLLSSTNHQVRAAATRQRTFTNGSSPGNTPGSGLRSTDAGPPHPASNDSSCTGRRD